MAEKLRVPIFIAQEREHMARGIPLTEEMIAKARELRAKGCSDRAIAARLGISPRTLRRWREQGEAGKEPYNAFYEALVQGEAELEEKCVSGIFEAGLRGQWQAFAWILERIYPERYARRDHIDARVEASVSWTELVRRAHEQAQANKS